MKMSNRLRRRLVLALLAILIAFATTATATFAWYIYQTNAHTTNIKMAVGAGVTLQISNELDGVYSSSTVMESFPGQLDPVSTNRITGGFQKVLEFARDYAPDRPFFLANVFGESVENCDYYKTSLFIRATGEERSVYLSDIGYEDKDEENPISSAIRIGFVVHEVGFYGDTTDADRNRVKEFIFELSKVKNPQKEYNTLNGEEGHVLDCDQTDGSTVLFTDLLDADNFCLYDSETGIVTLKEDSIELFKIKGDENDLNRAGQPVQVDVYVWLEGCDEDCTRNLLKTTLKNLSLAFACENK